MSDSQRLCDGCGREKTPGEFDRCECGTPTYDANVLKGKPATRNVSESVAPSSGHLKSAKELIDWLRNCKACGGSGAIAHGTQPCPDCAGGDDAET